MNEPTVGMRLARPTTIPSTSQDGIPMAHRPMVASTPTAADTMSLARTKPETILPNSDSTSVVVARRDGGMRSCRPEARLGRVRRIRYPRKPPSSRTTPARANPDPREARILGPWCWWLVTQFWMARPALRSRELEEWDRRATKPPWCSDRGEE